MNLLKDAHEVLRHMVGMSYLNNVRHYMNLVFTSRNQRRTEYGMGELYITTSCLTSSSCMFKFLYLGPKIIVGPLVVPLKLRQHPNYGM
jgi:hypothetical protein